MILYDTQRKNTLSKKTNDHNMKKCSVKTMVKHRKKNNKPTHKKKLLFPVLYIII